MFLKMKQYQETAKSRIATMTEFADVFKETKEKIEKINFLLLDLRKKPLFSDSSKDGLNLSIKGLVPEAFEIINKNTITRQVNTNNQYLLNILNSFIIICKEQKNIEEILLTMATEMEEEQNLSYVKQKIPHEVMVIAYYGDALRNRLAGLYLNIDIFISSLKESVSDKGNSRLIELRDELESIHVLMKEIFALNQGLLDKSDLAKEGLI